MDFLWILIAFVFGFTAKQLDLPPLIGYLIAGFLLHYFGVEPLESLDTLADLGITLLLFTIGLKLDVRSLFKLEVAGAGLSHMLLWTVFVTMLFIGLAWLGVEHIDSLTGKTALLLAFALSFSSTVCVIKVLEDKTELKTRHGKIAVGILVIQDIIAVVFLVFASGKIPSIWAIGLFALYFLRPVVARLVEKSGHDEMLPLVGFFLALGGYELFSAVDVKGDLGALIVGMMLASSSKATELYKSLMSFKDIFLIGFFLSIGFSALPTLDMLLMAMSLSLLLLVKFAAFFFILILIGMRARTAFLTGVAMCNYSEFGLIVTQVGVENGWVSDTWLVILALAVSISFIIISFFYRSIHTFYASHKAGIHAFQRTGAQNLAFDIPSGAEILIIGMGRVGTGAYDELKPDWGTKLWGIEADSQRALMQKQAGYAVAFADADDYDFWEQVKINDLKLVMLAIPSVSEMKSIIELLRKIGYQGRISTVAHYEDEREELQALGADVAFNYYAEVGAGFAEESRALLKQLQKESEA